MGSFVGHLIPGAALTLMGIWWAYNIFYKYHVARKASIISDQRRGRYKSTLLFPNNSCCKGAPIEAIFIIAASFTGIIAETVTGFRDGVFVNVGNTQHMSMHVFFGTMAGVFILLHYKFPLPANSDYAVALLAIANEWLLFSHHLHGRPHMDILVHTLLLYTLVGALACTFLEMAFKHQVLPALGRAYFTIIQGTWLSHIAYILYPYPGHEWDLASHPQMMVITTIFTAHLAAILIFFLILNGLLSMRVKSMNSNTVYQLLKDEEANTGANLKNPARNGQVNKSLMEDESDDEL